MSEELLIESGSSHKCVNTTAERRTLVMYAEQEGSIGRLATENRLGLPLILSIL